MKREYIDRLEALAKKRKSKKYKISVLLKRTVKQFLFGDKKSKTEYKVYFRQFFSHGQAICCSSSERFDSSIKEGKKLIKEIYDSAVSESSNEKIVIFSMHPYHTSGGGQRGAQLARAFSQLGYDVAFLFSQSSYYIPDKMNVPGLWLHLGLDNIEPIDFMDSLSAVKLAIFEFPSNAFSEYLEILNEKHICAVYEEIDNWDTTLGEGWFSREVRKNYLERCDILVGTCRCLCERMTEETLRRISYLPNACDETVFDCTKQYKVPSDFPVKKKTVLYYGHVAGNWQNWELLFGVARKCRDCVFVIIGYGEAETNEEIPDNLLFLGPKAKEELPAYLQHCSFTLLHFKNDDVGKYVSPIKVFEYLAMRKPVLATGLPDIVDYPNVIFSEDGSEWIDAINNGYQETDFSLFVENNTWKKRCLEMIRLSEEIDYED